jgi:hypothetical protein
MVRAVSKLIETPEVRPVVTKLAVLFAPSATIPPFQLPGVLQFQMDPLAAWLQLPLWAGATVETVSKPL